MSSTAGCLGKIGYRSSADANHALSRVKARRQEKEDDLRAYSCGKCGHWHLGRKGFDKRRELRRTPDHHRDSFKSRRARYLELIGESQK